MKILNVEPARYDEALRPFLEQLGDVTYVECESQRDFVDALSGDSFDVVLLRLGLELDGTSLDACPSLRYVATPTTGLNHIDLAAAHDNGVHVLSLFGEAAFLRQVRSTAEHTWALLLALVRRIPAAHHDVIAGSWRREPFLADELAGSTLGIIGLGRLGSMVAEFGRAFGMNLVAHDHTPDPMWAGEVEFLELEAALASSDVVSLHLPLDRRTRGIIGAEQFESMKPGSYLVNTARGELLDETALLRSLRSGHLRGAALDVLAGDSGWSRSRPAEHALVRYSKSHDNLIITPHIGGYGRQSISSTRRFILEKLAKETTKENAFATRPDC